MCSSGSCRPRPHARADPHRHRIVTRAFASRFCSAARNLDSRRCESSSQVFHSLTWMDRIEDSPERCIESPTGSVRQNAPRRSAGRTRGGPHAVVSADSSDDRAAQVPEARRRCGGRRRRPRQRRHVRASPARGRAGQPGPVRGRATDSASHQPERPARRRSALQA